MNKRYWLRGALIVGSIYTLLFVLYACFAYAEEGNSAYGGAGLGLALIPLVLSGLPTTLLLEWIVQSLPTALNDSFVATLSVVFIFCVAQWFVIGALMGALYGKIKNRKVL